MNSSHPAQNTAISTGDSNSGSLSLDLKPRGTERLREATVRIQELGPQDETAWDSFVAGFPTGHLYQGWGWGDYKLRSGWEPVRLGVYRDDELIGGAQLLIKSFKFVSIAYVPRGPVVDCSDEHAVRMLVAALHVEARKRRAIFLKIEPNEPGGSSIEHSLRTEGFLVCRGEGIPQQPWATLKVDLTRDESAVLASMRSNTRRNIRAGAKALTIREGSGAKDIELFHRMANELADRRGFGKHSLQYYQDLFEVLGPRDQAKLYLAEEDGQCFYGIMPLAFGHEGMFLHAGSIETNSKTPANHVLQWKAMQWCKEKGCTHYDLWGVFERRSLDRSGTVAYQPLDEKDMSPTMRGIFWFKQGFGAESMRYVGAFAYPYNRAGYELWEIGSRLPRQFAEKRRAAIDLVSTVRTKAEGLRSIATRSEKS
jgi:lipid II:glycine glycyltransferase (peptidoglycan interpeptide bridge formation enzyme)